MLLSILTIIHDALVLTQHQFDNHPLWAPQEWGLWYLLTPITFRLLNHLYDPTQATKKRPYILVGLVIFCCSMTYQAIFDFYFYHDEISRTLVYFAPSHPVVIGIIMAIWYHFLKEQPATEHHAQTLLVDSGKDKVVLPLEDIININSASNYVEIFTHEKMYLKRTTLKEIEQRLPAKYFIRTHRCHLININYMARIQTSLTGSLSIVMKNGQPVNLSKTYKHQVKQLWHDAA
ncbi:hypothetical protein BGP78_18665 [Pseudoalteromonas sp. MSK9-3]|uniref:LytR/AlgR family response regulator transcription factor n=1 Tax=Pseudoalteromonas sp. MSK9-3 TaxID=1897633 RepID=UPI000E6CB838|nr:LytTR family DNA-binding domain-containing protein [Pseudoalteromonas sp. MSK9-3]RJE73438.1 hypothetical protein BGP78_18665 [Pseudoalteromonas sp. MSK9-3]